MSFQPGSMTPPTELAVVALGANLESPAGTPAQTIEVAMERLRSWSVSSFQASSLFRTTPQGCPPGTPDFINGVVRLELPAETEAAALLQRLQALEAEFGRARSGQQNESRTLDLDLICLGERQIRSPDLTLPHPRAHLRRFVLEPLGEIAPGLVLPGQEKTIAELLQSVSSESDCVPLGRS